MSRKLVFASFFAIASLAAMGQRQVEHQSLYWVKYGASFSVGEKWDFKPSVEDRRYFKNNRQHMWLFNFAAERTLQNGWSLGLGLLKWSIIFPSDPESTFEVTQHEWRPYQYLAQRRNLSPKWTWKSRFMFEQRFRQNVSFPDGEAPKIEDGYYSYVRIRTTQELVYKITSGESLPLSVSLSNEMMMHWGIDRLPNMFDQNRASIKLIAGVTKNISVTAGYLHWYQQQGGAANYVQRNIGMLYITQNF